MIVKYSLMLPTCTLTVDKIIERDGTVYALHIREDDGGAMEFQLCESAMIVFCRMLQTTIH